MLKAWHVRSLCCSWSSIYVFGTLLLGAVPLQSRKHKAAIMGAC